MEQRINLKFLVNFLSLCHPYASVWTWTCTKVFEWCKKLKKEREMAEDDVSHGRTCTRTKTLKNWSVDPWKSRIRVNFELIGITKKVSIRLCMKHATLRILDPSPAQCANPYTTLSVKAFWIKHTLPVSNHPPYSPDVAPCEFYLFQNIKPELQGQAFIAWKQPEQKWWWLSPTRQKRISSTALHIRKFGWYGAGIVKGNILKAIMFLM